MALDDIKKAILAEARKTAEEQKKEGEQKIEAIKTEWKIKTEERKKEIVASAVRKINQKIQQAQFKVQAQSQSQILNQKQQIIDKVFKLALKNLSDLNEVKKVSLLVKLIDQLPKGEGVLLSAQGQENLLKKALQKSGGKYEISSETIPGAGGFIFKSKDIEVNQTFDALIENAKEKTLIAVTETVFGV